MTSRVAKEAEADCSTALKALQSGSSVYPGYAVCRRVPARYDGTYDLKVVLDNLTWHKACAAVDAMPADYLVCLMAGVR